MDKFNLADSQVPFALGRIIDLIYSLDQLKTETEEEQKASINDRLKKVSFRCSCNLRINDVLVIRSFLLH